MQVWVNIYLSRDNYFVHLVILKPFAMTIKKNSYIPGLLVLAFFAIASSHERVTTYDQNKSDKKTSQAVAKPANVIIQQEEVKSFTISD